MYIEILLDPRTDHAVINPTTDLAIRSYIHRKQSTVDHTVILELATNRVIITAHTKPMTVDEITNMTSITESNNRATIESMYTD